MIDRAELREKVAREICKAHGDDPDQMIDTLLHDAPQPCWRFYYGHMADAAIAVALEEAAREADNLGYECEGCGHLCGNPETDMKIIIAAGGLSCCPERKMRPLGAAIRAMITEKPND